jgi:hypothetical protein
MLTEPAAVSSWARCCATLRLVADPAKQRLNWGGVPGSDLFDRAEDPKGWDRASIRVNTHPLHRLPRVTQADLLLPRHADRLRLAGDAIVFGACLGLLCFFPLWIADVMADGRIANWVWGTMLTVGVLGAVLLFVASAGRSDADYLERY